MKQKIKSFISLKATSAMFGLLFFVALAGGMAINAPMVSAAAPTLTSAIFTDDALKVGETSLVTFTFSEAISGFTNADLIIANGTLTVVVDASAETIWTATFTPTDNLEAATNVITVDMTGVADVATSTSGVGSTDSSNYAIDTKEPTAAITYSDADGIVKAGDSLTITATFNEEMADLPVVQIALSGANTVIAVSMTKATTTSYTYDHTVVAGNGTVTVALSTGTDVAANVITTVPTSGATFTVDNTAPVMISAIYKDTDDNGTVDEIVVTYSEDIEDSTFVESEWSFDPNPRSLVIDSGSISLADIQITVIDPDNSENIDGTIIKYTAGTGIVDDAGNYAVDGNLLIVAEGNDDDDDEDNDITPPDDALDGPAEPNPNSGVTLYRMSGDNRVYVIKNKKKRWIKTAREFERNGYNWDEIQEISTELLEEFPEAEALITELLRAIGDYRVYRLEEGKKSWIKTAKEFEDCGYNWGNIQEVSPETLASYQNIVSSNLLRAIGDKKVYRLENGKKRWIKTAGEFNAAGYNWGDIEEVTTEALDDYPDSE